MPISALPADLRNTPYPQEALSNLQGQRVLDIGCGDGSDVYGFFQLGADAFGLDKGISGWDGFLKFYRDVFNEGKNIALYENGNEYYPREYYRDGDHYAARQVAERKKHTDTYMDSRPGLRHRLLAGDGLALPFPDESFDRLYSRSSIFTSVHFLTPGFSPSTYKEPPLAKAASILAPAIEEAARVLKPGGKFYMTAVNKKLIQKAIASSSARNALEITNIWDSKQTYNPELESTLEITKKRTLDTTA